MACCSVSYRMMAESPEVFLRFVAAINAHDCEALAALMTADHVFVDSLGNSVQGAARMRAGWHAYFAMCPDYWIQVDKSICEDATVLAVGRAGGAIDNIPWQIPAAWQAVIRGDLVCEWRVFADNKPVCEILAKRG